MTIYETWEERDGATMRQRVGTDAPAGIRLIDADDYEAELQAVMHSVDKWFDEVPNDNPATRATAAREVALQDIERVEAKYQRLRGILRNLYENRMEGDKLYIILDRPETKAALTEQGENRE